jgi:preprotein translocase subunit SecA
MGVSATSSRDTAILDSIRKRKSRPALVLFASINESITFTGILRKSGVEHLVLNDDQKEDEDFILNWAGRLGAVTVATNTAGSGTDTVLTATALSSGGLAFFVANLRVDVKPIGQCGRQGQ